jgi:hypothetical protein
LLKRGYSELLEPVPDELDEESDAAVAGVDGVSELDVVDPSLVELLLASLDAPLESLLAAAPALPA